MYRFHCIVHSSSTVTHALTYRVHIWTVHRGIFVLDDSLQIRQLVPNLEYFLKLVIIFDDNNIAPCMVADELASFGRICCIYSSCKPTTNMHQLVISQKKDTYQTLVKVEDMQQTRKCNGKKQRIKCTNFTRMDQEYSKTKTCI